MGGRFEPWLLKPFKRFLAEVTQSHKQGSNGYTLSCFSHHSSLYAGCYVQRFSKNTGNLVAHGCALYVIHATLGREIGGGIRLVVYSRSPRATSGADSVLKGSTTEAAGVNGPSAAGSWIWIPAPQHLDRPPLTRPRR